MIVSVVACDLCEALQEEGGPLFAGFAIDMLIPRVHVCPECLPRPVGDLAAAMKTVKERVSRARSAALSGVFRTQVVSSVKAKAGTGLPGG